MLSDVTLAKRLADSSIIIGNLAEGAVQPASIDLRLGHDILVRRRADRAPWRRDWQRVDITGGYRLRRKQFALGTTFEHVSVPGDLCGILYGRSSIGRGGLQVENAGLIDPGFQGEITLELFNALDETVVLTPGQPIAQIVFHQLTEPVLRLYGPRIGSHYQGQRGATAPRTCRTPSWRSDVRR